MSKTRPNSTPKSTDTSNSDTYTRVKAATPSSKKLTRQASHHEFDMRHYYVPVRTDDIPFLVQNIRS